MTVAQEAQTTPIVTGTDIFTFTPSDTVTDGPGAPNTESATPAPETADHPGEAAAPSEEPLEPAEKQIDPAAAPPAEKAPADNKPRFKDHQAAEEGYRNLQGKTTRVEQEMADLKRQLDEIKAQRQQMDEQAAMETRRQAAEKAIEDYTRERNEKALEAIEALDPDDPEHRKKVAGIWSQFYTDVRRFEGQQQPGGTANPAIPAQPTAVPAPEQPVRTPDPPTEDRHAQIRSYIDGKARDAGIDPESDELWVGVALTTPTVAPDGKVIPLDDQIQWTINRYNERKAAIQSRARQAANLPLGEGGNITRRTTEAPAMSGPISLGDAVARANERRRL